MERWRPVVFWATTLVFLAGVGIQISVLSTAIKLCTVNVSGWSFGQVVAVTIWIPPLLEFVCREISKCGAGKFYSSRSPVCPCR